MTKYINTTNTEDKVTLPDIFRRYYEINGTADGFEEYVKSGFRNGNEVEYEPVKVVEVYFCGYGYFKTDSKHKLYEALTNAGIDFCFDAVEERDANGDPV